MDENNYKEYIEPFISFFNKNPQYISNKEIERYIIEKGLIQKYKHIEALTKFYKKNEISRVIFCKYDYRKIHKAEEIIKYTPENVEEFKNSLKLKRYSKRTIDSYLSCLFISNKWFIENIEKNINYIDENDALKYFLYLTEEKKYKYSTVRMYRFSLEYYYVYIVKKPINLNFMNKVRREKHLPEVITNEEVNSIIETIENIKHKLIISLLYSSGLRVSEVVNLKVKDISLTDLTLRVRDGKGKKDRITIFSEKLFERIAEFIKNKEASDYLFTSKQKIGEKLSVRTVQQVFQRALSVSNIKKEVSCHDLRHSFATHLLESGVNLQYIQHLLGHKNISTTTIYTKVAKSKLMNIKSPL